MRRSIMLEPCHGVTGGSSPAAGAPQPQSLNDTDHPDSIGRMYESASLSTNDPARARGDRRTGPDADARRGPSHGAALQGHHAHPGAAGQSRLDPGALQKRAAVLHSRHAPGLRDARENPRPVPARARRPPRGADGGPAEDVRSQRRGDAPAAPRWGLTVQSNKRCRWSISRTTLMASTVATMPTAPTAIPTWVASLSCSAVRASRARRVNTGSSTAQASDMPHQPRSNTGAGRSSYPSRSLRESLRSQRSFMTW